MRTKELGSTGVKIPEVGIGTYRYGGTAELLRQGVDWGASFLDTAEHYHNEELVGKAIRGIRERVFIATKVKHWRRQQVLDCADASLQKLGVETIDLYQIHWPNAAVPIAETMSAMEELVDQGKIRHIGVSNFTLPELKEAQGAMRKYPISSNQVHYGITHRTIEPYLLPYCQAQQITVIAFSSLGHNYASLLKADRAGALARVAEETGKTKAQVALNWCLVQEGVTTIPKTESAVHMAENCASSDWRLTNEQKAALDRSVNYRRRTRVESILRRFIRGSLQRWQQRKLDKAN